MSKLKIFGSIFISAILFCPVGQSSEAFAKVSAKACKAKALSAKLKAKALCGPGTAAGAARCTVKADIAYRFAIQKCGRR